MLNSPNRSPINPSSPAITRPQGGFFRALLKQFELRSQSIVQADKSALMQLPAQEEAVQSLTFEATDDGQLEDRFTPIKERVLAKFGGEPHELDIRRILLTICWIAVSTGGTVSALVAVGYWLNHLLS